MRGRGTTPCRYPAADPRNAKKAERMAGLLPGLRGDSNEQFENKGSRMRSLERSNRSTISRGTQRALIVSKNVPAPLNRLVSTPQFLYFFEKRQIELNSAYDFP